MLCIKRLIWDKGNVAHIARHRITPNEVEQVCHSKKHIVRESYGGRLMLIGQTRAKRMLAVIIAPHGEEIYYVVTARPADNKERRIYQGKKGGRAT